MNCAKNDITVSLQVSFRNNKYQKVKSVLNEQKKGIKILEINVKEINQYVETYGTRSLEIPFRLKIYESYIDFLQNHEILNQVKYLLRNSFTFVDHLF